MQVEEVELTPAQANAIGRCLYEYDAPRYGNGIRPYSELGEWEQRKFAELARIAVRKYVEEGWGA